MRVRFALLLLPFAVLIAPGSAAADCVHVVLPGESLTSIAAADGLSIDQLAAANGLSSGAGLLSGSCLTIPPQSGPVLSSPTAVAPVSATAASGDGDNDSDDSGVTSATGSTGSSGGSYVVQPGDTLTAIAARAGTSVSQLAGNNGLDPMAPLLSGTVLQLSGSGQTSSLPQSSSGGSYVVQPGDTLSGIAARAGMSLSDLAALNGLNPLEPLLSGTALRLAGSGSAGTSSVATAQPVGAAAEGSAVNPPYPTPVTVSPSEVGTIAAANGVPPALADAIAYQESGFNNAAVSTSDARGVMQILPGTWDYIQNSLTPGSSPLAPASATDNVRGGVLLLHALLNATGGNAAMAAAGYYQGLPSVEANGMYGDTQQYVNNVLALEQRFNGGG